MSFCSATFGSLENEIDERVVFLGGQDDQGEPAERETKRRLGQTHVLGPIPGLPSGPDDKRGNADREQVIRLVKNSAQQDRPRLGLTEPEHAGEILQGAGKIRGAEEN